MMLVTGLDIGGANLKAASTENQAHSLPFAIWQTPEKLTEKLEELVSGFKTPDCYAVTMTAELADCFQTKAEGVEFILDSVEKIAGTVPVQVWQTGAEFVTPAVAKEIPLLVAASNWHALCTWIGRLATEGNALLIDIGSTTTDLIPLQNGVPVPSGLTDPERLKSGELVYTGVKRTPLCSLASEIVIGQQTFRTASELFATTQDVYLLLKKNPEDQDSLETANGRPATVDHAYDRMTRMICADRNEFSLEEMKEAAGYFSRCQKERIIKAIDQVMEENQLEEVTTVLCSGEGEFLVDEIVSGHPILKKSSYTKLSDLMTPETSNCACAIAVSRLASERIRI